MNYPQLQKHIAKITKDTTQRPVLGVAHYESDGSLTVTDSHRILHIKEFHHANTSYNIDPTDLTINEDNYPFQSVMSIIPPTANAKIKSSVSMKSLKRAVRSLMTFRDEIVQVSLTKDTLTVTNLSDKKTNHKYSVSMNAENSGKNTTVFINGRYLIEAINCLLDLKMKYASDTMTLHITTLTKPIVIVANNPNVEYVVTPVRQTTTV